MYFLPLPPGSLPAARNKKPTPDFATLWILVRKAPRSLRLTITVACAALEMKTLVYHAVTLFTFRISPVREADLRLAAVPVPSHDVSPEWYGRRR